MPAVTARHMVIETEHPVLGTVRQPASPVRVGDEQVEHRRAPLPDEHADDVLRGLLGYDDARIDDLRSAGAFGRG